MDVLPRTIPQGFGAEASAPRMRESLADLLSDSVAHGKVSAQHVFAKIKIS